MSVFIQHIKLATENIVLMGSPETSKKDQYEYAERMEGMLKRQLKEELEQILLDKDKIHDNLLNFINKIKP